MLQGIGRRDESRLYKVCLPRIGTDSHGFTTDEIFRNGPMRCRDADLSRLLHYNGNYPCKICLMLQGNMEDADLSRLLYYNGNYPCEIRVDPWANMPNAA